MRNLAWLLVFAAALSAAASAGTAGRDLRVVPRADGQGMGARYAVIVAVGDYEDATLSDLKYAVADAQALCRLLTDPNVGGFEDQNVVLLSDKGDDEAHKPTRDNILTALAAQARRAASPEDTILFFFSGHGGDEGRQTCLLGSDALSARPAESGVPLARVRELLSPPDCRAARKIAFLDCCHGGAASDAFVQELGRWQGTATFASCKQGEKSHDLDDEGHGAFSHFLMEGLKGAADADSNGFVDLGELQKHVCQRTSARVTQRGLAQNPFCRVDASGAIYLSKASGPDYSSPKATFYTMWDAEKAGNRHALLACLSDVCRKKIAELEKLMSDPMLGGKPEEMTSEDMRRARDAEAAVGAEKIDGDKATLEVTIRGDRETLNFIKEGGAWKLHVKGIAEIDVEQTKKMVEQMRKMVEDKDKE